VAIEVPPFEMMKDNKTPEFLAMSPLGKTPVLKTPKVRPFSSLTFGIRRSRQSIASYAVACLLTPFLWDQGALFESNAIARYVARMRTDTGLYGATFFESGQVRRMNNSNSCESENRHLLNLHLT
jgi:elongation factor 1-gamma